MATWANLLGYQAAWFATVWGAGRGMPWLGVLACTVFVAWQLGVSRRRGDDARVLLAALACGLVIEATLSLAGLMRHAATPSGWPAPAWIVALWGAFALTLNHSMAWFARRRWIAAAFAGVGAPLAYLGAPLAYLGAARGFGAVAFATPVWHGVLMLGLAWAIALPLLLRMGRRPLLLHREAHA